MKTKNNTFIKWFDDIGMNDVGEVGGKNASLGEMRKNLVPLGINVPDGFATTAYAYRMFIAANNLEEPIREQIERYRKEDIQLDEAGLKVRKMIGKGIFPIALAEAIKEAYKRLSIMHDHYQVDVAVRSSATAEDLPTASFAGLQETYLNVRGEDELLKICKSCFASLFTDRAISYREDKGFDHMEVALSVGVQKMVKADHSGSGVMFTIDTETGFPNVVLINAAWGLGEHIVQGTVNPDQYTVFKPLLPNEKDSVNPILQKKLGSKEQKMIYTEDDNGRTKSVVTTPEEQNSFVLNDDEIIQLANWGLSIENHYRSPMDIEWVKDEKTGKIFIVQARPETVHSSDKGIIFKSFKLKRDSQQSILTGQSIGSSIVHGRVCKVDHISDLKSVGKGCIMVTEMTEPDWVPAMKQVAGIITDYGGRTCHAAIVSREMGIPAIVGTKVGTNVLADGSQITLSCAEGEEGAVFDGFLDYEVTEVNLDQIPNFKTDIMLNLATPDSAFKWWKLPVNGVGLARMEFIISNHIKIHPMALINFDKVIKEHEREKIRKLTKGYKDKRDYFVDRLSEGIAKIAASKYPNPVIVRTSDFKTNEYASLVGGEAFEPDEENPMLGWRGASRYYSENYCEGFALECYALRRVREEMGLENVIVMIPFCRTTGEAERVLQEMKANGLQRGSRNLQVYMMCEIPANVILLEDFAHYFDGFSIGSNDLTQLILGVDRDSPDLAYLFDEHNPAVKKAVMDIIQRAHKVNAKVGFCGQAPSDDPEYAAFLVNAGIDSISLNPDSVVNVIRSVAEAEQKKEGMHV
ncbi:phosphoenolpyruvate synthase [Aliifodinibius sp. S!AR15-10]|uniref:phosphoenolpyruvate synthase n=1 Tax=Aliifodinibius sp. S!AR15-10 TaxID=2950437 RepID=UPI00286400CF|nr:phosphoenolpyruvate synthase [Aliifodinibius sp. S!AR15-10]MDR8393255.1 phosphoenolpyruvate synthase [Aliifodinibius sp. S!AR15-10]